MTTFSDYYVFEIDQGMFSPQFSVHRDEVSDDGDMCIKHWFGTFPTSEAAESYRKRLVYDSLVASDGELTS